MTTTYYKCFGFGMSSPYGSDLRWDLPTQQADGTYKPGKWQPVEPHPILCQRGYHACTLADLPHWLNAQIYVVELGKVVRAGADKVVSSRVRLVRPTGWNEQRARLFGADCALYAITTCRNLFDADTLAHVEAALTQAEQSLVTVRRYADGQATADELSAAESAARSAARSAAESAAESAARIAAWSAAWSAAIAWQADRLALYLADVLPDPMPSIAGYVLGGR